MAMAVGVLGLGAVPADAAEHVTVTGEYGKEGAAASGLGNGCRLAYQSSTQRLYLLSDGKIYGLSVSAGSATPLGAGFPIETGYPTFRTSCGDSDLEVSSTNIFAVPSETFISAWNGSGGALGAPWPVDIGGETCGLAVTSSSEVWGGNYGKSEVTKLTSAGTPNGAIPLPYNDCKIAVDPGTGDLYSVEYSGGGIKKYTAASGYTTAVPFPTSGSGNAGLAVNGAEDRLYVAGTSQEIKAYNTNTAELVETINVGGAARDVAVDENTDTLFVADTTNGVIKEYLGLTVPKATTNDPIGNSEVSGTADPNGVGPITHCYFEYGLTTSFGMSQDCNEPVPFNTEQEVTATLPNLIGEETYHYRLVLDTGEPNVIGRGGDKTIVPHNVKGLETEPATDVTQDSATLNASFEGTNEDTTYYFEWGRGTSLGHTTPVEDAGVTVGPTSISTELTGLKPGAIYYYRVVAENDIGISKVAPESFTTYEPPSILVASSSEVTATTAKISASINPNGFDTEYEVEYGPTESYGQRAPTPPGEMAAGNAAEAVSVRLSGLESIPYHFRVVARSVWGTTVSPDQTFTFFPPSCPNSRVRQKIESSYLPDCRAYELVSPGSAGNILLRAVSRPAPYAQNPSRFLFIGLDGVLSGTEGTNALTADTYVATRTIDGWNSKYTGIHADETINNFFGVGSRTLDKFISFNTGCCSKVPYVFDNNENFLGRWPADWADFPGTDVGINDSVGEIQPSPDFTHMAFSSQINFDPGEEGKTSAPGSAYDYDVGAETTEVISRTPGGGDILQDPANGDPGEVIEFPGSETRGDGMPKEMYPSVSIDGSHILMSTRACGGSCTEKHLYMRVKEGIPVTYEIAGGAPVEYYGLTSDGTKVFFASDEQLTDDDHDSSVDLYMWSEAGELAGEPLTRLSAGTGGKGDTDACSASWIGKCDVALIAGSANTDYPIATASGDVYFYSPEALDASEDGVPGARNLYLYRGGAVQFVTTLSLSDSGALTRIQVSSDGSHAAFVTSSKLTTYENAGFHEMYSFDPSTGAVNCVSCNPSGEPPSVEIRASTSGFFMSDDGRTFFGTDDSLVPKDTNEGSDVYEFVDGRPQLISTGRGEIYRRPTGRIIPIELMGVSPNGVDVYIATYDTLVPQDENGAFLKFYDARTAGGFDFRPASPPCEAADECHGSGSVPPATAVVTSDASLGADNSQTQAKKRIHKRKKHRRRSKKHGRKAGQRSTVRAQRRTSHG
jgi:hypothetical protein